MSDPIKVLILDDVPSDAELMQHELRKSGLQFTAVLTDKKDGFVEQLEKFRPDIILSDYRLPSFDGLAALEIVRELSPDTPFLIVSGSIGEEQAVEAIKRGASDYILKDRIAKLGSAVERELREAKEHKKLHQAQDDLVAKNMELQSAKTRTDEALQTSERSRLALLSVLEDAKKAEQELKNSEEKWRMLVSTSPDFITLHDLEGKYLYLNHYAEGFSENDVIGKSLYDFIAEESREKYKKAFKTCIETKATQYIEYTAYGDNATIRTYETYLVPVMTKDQIQSIMAIAKDITERKQAEQALEDERRQLLSIFGGMSEIVYIADPDTYELLYANEAFKKAFGDNIGEKCHKAIQNEATPCTFCTNQYIFGSHVGETHVWEFQNEINKSWYRCVDRAIRWSDGRMVRFEMAIDITDSKKAQESTLASLKEKEVMLKEIHHRVKNNLQIIASLLNLQTGYVKDERYKKMFLESQARVRAMALVHEKLYKSKDLARIDFAEYVGSLLSEQYQAYGVDPERVSLEINISEKHLPLDTAIPCGLLINELVSNSLKYAFKNREGRGRIEIALHKNKDGEYKLEVGDNGAGLSDDFDVKSTSTLGLQLVDALVGQLDATLEISKTPGAKFVITFKVL